jgi:iron only hydrogenase large subunit-like protein
MEAALRTAAATLGVKLDKLELDDVRGTEGIKRASYKLGEHTVNVAVASGTANAKKLLEAVKAGEKIDFIEIMACPGGCVNGGGQPIQPMSLRNTIDLRAIRAKVLYDADKDMPLRESHKNPEVDMLYKEYFEKPGSHKAHEILHTSYVKRGL